MRVTGKDILHIEDFMKEKNTFYILLGISELNECTLYSDLETYIIGRCEIGYPTWIWTKDDITITKMDEISSILDQFLVPGNNKITSKKELYDYLKKTNELSDYYEMAHLICEKPIYPVKEKGIFAKANHPDKVTIAEYFRKELKETKDKELSQKEALNEVEAWLEQERIYVLKDTTGEIVSIACYTTVQNMAKITHVFTPKEERNKGYCQYLIYQLTKKLIEEGYKTLLYTDKKYEPSNRAYKNVGYEEKKVLINYTFSKLENKSMI